MGIRKREGFWHYRFQLNGQQYSGTTGLAAIERNRKAARAFEAERRAEAKEESRGIPFAKLLFSEAAAAYLTFAKHTTYPNKASTYQRIRVSFTSLIEKLGLEKVMELDTPHVEAYKTWRLEMGVKEISLRHDLHALSLFFQWCKTQKIREGNPVQEVKMPSGADSQRINPLSRETEEKYFAIAKRHPDLYDLGRLMIQQGCRPDEIRTLRVSRIDLERGQMNVGTKTKASKRTLDLTGESIEILTRRIAAAETDWIFPSDRKPGHPIVRSSRTHDKVCEEAGVSFVPYDLRHTFATRFMEVEGNDIVALAAIMGHASLRLVQVYCHPSAAHKKEAMERFEAAQLRRKLKIVG